MTPDTVAKQDVMFLEAHPQVTDQFSRGNHGAITRSETYADGLTAEVRMTADRFTIEFSITDSDGDRHNRMVSLLKQARGFGTGSFPPATVQYKSTIVPDAQFVLVMSRALQYAAEIAAALDRNYPPGS